ncbi:MAG: SUMF1/EgtB/PvdO family nonheme iron enzyme [Chloroflexota bacterium]
MTTVSPSDISRSSDVPRPPALNLEFVLIPGGEFQMGSTLKRDRRAQSDEMPQHQLHITDYHIMRYPVTNEQYRQFVEATGHRAPLFGWVDGKFPADKADHPVVGVSLQDALDFCHWAAEVTGLPLRLPTEPEWEKAARGADGLVFPWGNTWEAGRCNSAEAKLGGTTPVGQFSPQGDSPFGVADMGGNTQEWCQSMIGPYPYDPQDGRDALLEDTSKQVLLPKQHEMGTTSVISSTEANLDKSVIRGGSWREESYRSRCAYRGWGAPLHRSDDTGFRCCYEP